MKIIVTIQHPAHVHLFRNTIRELLADEHEVHVFAREKDIATSLLERYDIPYTVLASTADSIVSLASVQLRYELKLLQHAREIDPDVLIAKGEPAITHVAKLLGSNSIIFTDTEHATLQNRLAFPFADRICTPICYWHDIGRKQIRYPGYHELAYLHPNRFKPDPSILDEVGIDGDDPIVIVRLVSWQAAHDIGDSGFADAREVVQKLEQTGACVLITAEDDLPRELEDRRVNVPIHRIHDLMYYADLFIGESATMATECAVLGTPAVFVSSSRRGYTDELEERYGLVFNFSTENRQQHGLSKAVSILDEYDPETWQRRREKLLEEKIDTTEFILQQVLSFSDKTEKSPRRSWISG